MTDPVACPACGTPQTQTGWAEELCPSCLLRLALQPLSQASESLAELETDYMPPRHEGPLSPGKVLGNRYSVRKLLGRGGMGEVWRAFDLKLRVEVALKAMRQDLFKDEKRLEMLRSEVRAAREVVSPNVCRIFDLIEVDGTELVSMEYVDGQTLLEVLQDRGPLELKEAQDIASQFLAGLEAIHKAGLVHRDVKPENIMVTRAGRVVVMDFGLARQEDSGAGTVAGTPAYMAPEQAAGLEVDARADVYAAGVVLAEMVSPEGIKSLESRQSLWEGVRSEPAKLPDTPWAPVLKKAVAKEREQRYTLGAHADPGPRGCDAAGGGRRGPAPLPWAGVVHRGRRRVLLRPRGRGGADVAHAGGPPRLLGVGGSVWGRQDLISQGRADSCARATRWAVIRCTPGNITLRHRSARCSHLRTRRRRRGDARCSRRSEDSEAAVELVSRWRGRHRPRRCCSSTSSRSSSR